MKLLKEPIAGGVEIWRLSATPTELREIALEQDDPVVKQIFEHFADTLEERERGGEGPRYYNTFDRKWTEKVSAYYREALNAGMPVDRAFDWAFAKLFLHRTGSDTVQDHHRTVSEFTQKFGADFIRRLGRICQRRSAPFFDRIDDVILKNWNLTTGEVGALCEWDDKAATEFVKFMTGNAHLTPSAYIKRRAGLGLNPPPRGAAIVRRAKYLQDRQELRVVNTTGKITYIRRPT